MSFDRDHWRALARDLNITYDVRVDTETLRKKVESKLTSILKEGGHGHGGNRGFKGIQYQYFGLGMARVGTLVVDSKSRHVASIEDIRGTGS